MNCAPCVLHEGTGSRACPRHHQAAGDEKCAAASRANSEELEHSVRRHEGEQQGSDAFADIETDDTADGDPVDHAPGNGVQRTLQRGNAERLFPRFKS